MEKKEVQKKILEKAKNNNATEEEFVSILRSVAPGTHLRSSLDGTLRTGKGALIIVENENTFDIFDGGFWLNTRFTPQKLVELSKMDGAIILSKDMKRISYANVLLTPSSKISTNETGTRHKAAERSAKQAGTLTIAISERRNEITIYYKNLKYPLVPTGDLLRKANENIQLLEKQRAIFDKQVEKLDTLELLGSSNLRQTINVIQKGRIIVKLADDLSRYLIELGKEGTLLRMRLKEITIGVEKETDLVVKDYTQLDLKRSKNLLHNLSYDSVLDEESIAKILGYEGTITTQEIKGWRILSRTCLSDSEIASLIKEKATLVEVLDLKQNTFVNLFGEEKARTLKGELDKISTSV
ncbi:MAG: DNA integrity scanning diadenylate cyclase DisA [Nanoarchaeota archaeon]|nr:DNA integrity scanning diadenylate cyclase DisA [Nanoarchaeota archaeon]MBU1051380.1 DNA integrity scanning diadenylate cyclase DisA [Nanoarchaeota archaeon]MBU1987868.1 DNA integrity scanning diadenylate cyclase DisA [Nanoarchaeota archaeon]